jgi:anti-sigma factor RsiW
VTPPRDSELMQLADGELDPTAAAVVEAAMGTSERAKVAALRDLGEAVRGHLELQADAASPRLARLWDEIDKRITIAEREKAPAPAAPAPAPPGFWGRLGRWLDDHRSHVVTGVLSAGAVAAVALFLQPAPGGVKTVYVTNPTPGIGSDVAAPAAPTLVRSTPPVVESLEVTGGTGTVFTIEDEDGGTAVIWVTPEDTVEGL